MSKKKRIWVRIIIALLCLGLLGGITVLGINGHVKKSTAEQILSPEDAFVCREASVIHKDILRGDTYLHGLQLHGLDLVVVLLAVVAAHEQLRSRTGLVQFNASAEPIRQHIAGATTIMDITT